MLRLRTFCSKCTPQALEYLDEHVNDWAEKENADIVMTNMSFGVIEGKGGQREPNLFMNIWYKKSE